VELNLLLPYDESICINIALAKEIGLYESIALLQLYKEIEDRGVKKDGLRQIAKTKKQLRELFNWCKSTQIEKLLQRLESSGYIFISENTLFDDSALWFCLNEDKLKEIKSIVIMSDYDITEAHTTPPPRTKEKTNESGESTRFKALFGAFLKTCHWDKAPTLAERDRSEIGAAVKSLLKDYPDNETEDLRLMILGFDTYRIAVLKQSYPYRPSGIMRAWTDYETYCIKHLNGNPPAPQKDSYE
jgi:hypothetical protein